MARWTRFTVWMLGVVAVAYGFPAHAGQITYSGYSVLNNNNVELTESSPAFDERGGSGQIGLSGTKYGSIWSYCVDIFHNLASSGQFTTGQYLKGTFGDNVNALMTHVLPTLGTDPNASSALQLAIWRVEYGSALSVKSDSASAFALSDQYLANLANRSWVADPTKQVSFLSGNGVNQDQATMVDVPEAASIMILGSALVGLGLLRRWDI
ncbi:MAG: hypothetical protein NVSMB18_12240 [Acetobacteraceae bacterium]